jgi:vitamin B12 transporter
MFSVSAVCLAIMLYNATLQAQIPQSSDIIVTATKIPTAKDSSASSIFVINQDDIKSSQKSNLFELFNSIAMVQVNQSGPGGTVTLQLKGSESGHILVILDGLIINDAINTNALFDFNQISLQSIEKIEILPGSQSVIYGSSAIGGVINIISKSNLGKSSVSLAMGSQNNILANQHFSSKIGGSNINFGYSFQKTDGYNATTKTSKNPAEKDGFQKQNLSLVVRHKNSLLGDLLLSSRVHLIKNDLDKGFGSERDDSNYSTKDKFYFHSLKIKPKFKNNYINPEFYLGISKADRKTDDLSDSLSSFNDSQAYLSEILQVKVHNVFYLSDQDIVISGIDYLNESGSFNLELSGSDTVFAKKGESHLGIYAHYQKDLSPFILNLGVRTENHKSNMNTVFKIGPSFLLADYKLKIYSLFSTGFKTPSLYQLHSQYGNINLQSETSSHLEFGVEQKINQGLYKISVFKTDIKNLIDVTGNFPNYLYENSSAIIIKGIAFESKFSLLPKYLDYHISAQKLYAINKATGAYLINRPHLKLTQSIKINFKDDNLLFTHIFTSERNGGSTTAPVTLPEHHLINFNYGYKLTKELLFNGSVINLFDKDYQQVSGFHTGGRTWKASARYLY